MAEFDRNFTIFPDHPSTEESEDSNFVSSIFNKVKSITTAASNVVHSALPLPNVDTLITSGNVDAAIASTQLSRPGRILSNHAPIQMPVRSHPQALKELKYSSASHSRNSSSSSFKTKNGPVMSETGYSPSHSRNVSSGKSTGNTPLSGSHLSTSIDVPLSNTDSFGNQEHSTGIQSLDANKPSHADSAGNLDFLPLLGTVPQNDNQISSVPLAGGETGSLQLPKSASSTSTASISSSAAKSQHATSVFSPSAPSLSLSKLTSEATVDRDHITATGTFSISQPTEIFNLRQQNSRIDYPHRTNSTHYSTNPYPHHHHIHSNHHNHHHSHHHRTHKSFHRSHPTNITPSASSAMTQSGNHQQSTYSAPYRYIGNQGVISATLGTISQGVEALQSKLSLSSITDTTSNATNSNSNGTWDGNQESSYSSFRDNGSLLDRENSSDAESIYSTAKRYFNSRVDRRPAPLKNGGLGKEFWMKDEHVTECFGCTAKFTTFRRKHHCRICGQIFCSKCTRLVDCDYTKPDDAPSKNKAKLRVCNNCHADMEKFESSDEDDEYQEFHDHIDDAMSEFGGPTYSDANASVNPKLLTVPSDLHVDSPRAQLKRLARDDRTGHEAVPFYSDDESSSDESDTDSIIHYPIENNNSNKWGEDRSRSPSRSRNSFRRHRSGTSLSFDQPRFTRMGTRKKSFTAKTTPSFSAKPSGAGAAGSTVPAPLINLNRASIAHSKAFLRQTLENKGISGNLGKWIDALMSPLLECTSHIDLDNKIFEGSDFRSYVKLKRIPGGFPSHSQYIDGVVFSQTLTLKSMPQNISNPKILLAWNLFENPRFHVSKILEISRQELSRYDTLVQRVTQLKPNIILTTGGAGRFILKKFDQMGIAVITNVKESVIERTSRYTQASIATYETLSSNTILGNCSRFDIKTFRYQNQVKKYVFLSGIPKELGCTLLLRGTDMESLAIVKKIVQFMVYIMFNLKLETSLLREEFALVPETPKLLKEIVKHRANAEHRVANAGESPDSEDCFDIKILSTSPFVDFCLPYLLEIARKSEDQLVSMDDANGVTAREKLIQILQSDGLNVQNIPGGDETLSKMSEFLFQELYQRLYDTWFKQNRQWELAHLRDEDMFTAEFHLKIVLLFTSVCTETLTPCFGPDILTFRFYNEKQDMPLGHFIERLCLDANLPCSEGCGRTLKQHTRSYAHGNGNVIIKINDHTCNLPGMADSILMWSTCKVCHASTPILPMSDDTWKYSLGKYFELSFWSSELSFRENICPHNLYRDHVRFFGFKNIAVSIEYKPITLYEVVVPSARMTWQPERGLKLKVSFYNSIRESVEKFYGSVAARLNSVKVDELSPEKIEECRIKVNELISRTEEEKIAVVADLDQIFVSTEPTTYLPLNAVLRSMQDFAISWDFEFTEFENNYFLSENDITRITAAHLKRLFLPDDIYEKRGSQAKVDNEEIGNISEKSRKNSVDSITEKTAELIEEQQFEFDEADNAINEGIEMAVISPELSSTKEAPQLPPVVSSLSRETQDDGKTDTQQVNQPLEDLDTTSDKASQPTNGKVQSLTDISVTPTSISRDETAEKIDSPAAETESLEIPKDPRSESLDKLASIINETAANVPSNIPRAKSNIDNRLSKGKSITAASTESIPELTVKTPYRTSTRSPSPSHRGGEPGNRVHEAVSIMESRSSAKNERSGIFDFASSAPPSSFLTDNETFIHPSASQLSFKPRLSAIPLLKHPHQPHERRDSSSSSPDRMMEYAKLRLKYNPQKSEEEAASSSLSNHLNFRSKFDKVAYPNSAMRSRFGAPRDIGSQWSFGNASQQPNKISVSSLAKHFEQLSKEFEKERARERKLLAQTQYRAAPVATSKPIVEVYKNVEEAVEELSQSEDEDSDESDSDYELGSRSKKAYSKDSSNQGESATEGRPKSPSTNTDSNAALKDTEDTLSPTQTDEQGPHLEGSLGDGMDNNVCDSSTPEPTENRKDQEIPSPETSAPCAVEDSNLQQTERQGLLQYLANFWADRTATGWRPLEYPLTHSDHMFAESNVIIREDEPSSLIAFCLSYPDYKEKLRKLRQEEKASLDPEGLREPNAEMERHMLKNTGTHLKYQFQERSAKISCKIFYAEQFDAIRRQCDCEDSFIQSLSRCVKWDSSGGKSGSAFLKTLDDRLVVKELSQSELDAFIKFAPNYFEFMAQAFFHELPTALAKIFGFYQIQLRNPITHKTIKMDVLVMENLFYNRKTSRIFDLKGSMRNRHVQQTGRENEVLLDENMVEFIYESPLFVRNHSKTSLRLSLFNDTLFLAKMNVMDYSLVVAIDDERQELIVGIIDFIRTFTWDKKLESWVKERGLVGGGVKEPTVVSPKQYKFRFREAMERYIMMVPDCWYPVNQEEEEGVPA